MKFWEWLSGKKMVIATFLFLTVKLINEVVIGVWGYDTPLMGNVILTVEWFATALGGVGAMHKVKKAVTGDNRNPPVLH